MNWEIEYLPEVLDDLKHLDNSVKGQIKKGIEKVAGNPVSKTEGGYGIPLGNKQGIGLAGLYKIKFKGIGQRVVYALKRTETTMTVVVIAAREDEKVYREARKRRQQNKL